jgi:hypothetical protein
MFQRVLDQIEKGLMPDKKHLRQMLDAALTKKMGVLHMPYHCQPLDPKINPPVDQLMAVSAFLEDEEKVVLCLDILLTETTQRGGAGLSEGSDELHRRTDGVLALLWEFPEKRHFLEAALRRLAK